MRTRGLLWLGFWLVVLGSVCADVDCDAGPSVVCDDAYRNSAFRNYGRFRRRGGWFGLADPGPSVLKGQSEGDEVMGDIDTDDEKNVVKADAWVENLSEKQKLGITVGVIMGALTLTIIVFVGVFLYERRCCWACPAS